MNAIDIDGIDDIEDVYQSNESTDKKKIMTDFIKYQINRIGTHDYPNNRKGISQVIIHEELLREHEDCCEFGRISVLQKCFPGYNEESYKSRISQFLLNSFSPSRRERRVLCPIWLAAYNEKLSEYGLQRIKIGDPVHFYLF